MSFKNIGWDGYPGGVKYRVLLKYRNSISITNTMIIIRRISLYGGIHRRGISVIFCKYNNIPRVVVFLPVLIVK